MFYIQVVLQSVFIIRSINDPQLAENSNVSLVAASLFASLFSISNKYTWLDKDCMDDDVQDPEWSRKWPCINKWYVLRIIWRFSFVATRFCMISLIWLVLGGAPLGLFLVASFCVWCMPFCIAEEGSLREARVVPWGASRCWIILIASVFGLASLIATPAAERYLYVGIHGCEMVMSLTVITIFAYFEYECPLCADEEKRQANGNNYIQMFILGGWTTMMIDFASYGILLFRDKFEGNAWLRSIKIMGQGLDAIEKTPEYLEKERAEIAKNVFNDLNVFEDDIYNVSESSKHETVEKMSLQIEQQDTSNV